MKLYLGLGGGDFGVVTDYSVGAAPYQLATGDYDGYGYADLLATNIYQDYISLLPGACLSDARAPVLTDVRDVPNDQGSKVFVTWTRSSLDVSGGPVTQYRVWRRVPDFGPNAAAGDRDRGVTIESTRPHDGMDVEFWEVLASLPAQRMPAYGYTATTTQDSTGVGNPYNVFFITAATNDPDVFYNSNVDSGYSVDNIPPEGPVAFAAAMAPNGVALSWEANDDPDLDGYRLYRGATADFTPSASNRIASPEGNQFLDTGGSYGTYYKLTAIDTHGNESPHTTTEVEAPLSVIDGGVAEFALHGALPNPARGGALSIWFSLARGGTARIELLDLAGRRVVTRQLEGLSSGRQLVRLDGERRLAPGIYLVRLTQAKQVAERKIIVVE